MPEICPSIREWKVEIIGAGLHSPNPERNGRSQIIREIAHIGFPHLASLFLFHNMIESVEPLAMIHMPRLRKLILSNFLPTQLGTKS